MSDLLKVLQVNGFVDICSSVTTPARCAKPGSLETEVTNRPSLERVLATLLPTGIVWTHQGHALDSIFAGQNVVISTATASGKSLIFQVPILSSLLEGAGRHLVFYPQKSLAADQMNRWQQALSSLGLDPSWVQEINGDVPPCAREAALQNARVLLVTPDVIHAWLMRQSSSPAVQEFLAELRFVVLDEAHALEGAFGTAVAYLLRRLAKVRERTGATRKIQFIASSATIRDAASHLEALTGQDFVAVLDEHNGAPVAGTTLAHVAGAGHGRTAEGQLASLLAEVIPHLGADAFIAFADSRQGVERIARSVARDDVLPYRSGYEAADRRRIEEALRRGKLKGVISTSALELGIDIPQFVLGINLGLPQSRKALRQRVGRIGRSRPGLFLLITPAPTFAQLGTTFDDYVSGEVEPSPIYLENEYIQYTQARCLIEEHGAIEAKAIEGDPSWPASFAAMIDQARPGGSRPRELDVLAAAGGDTPHINYPLRQICEQTLALKSYGSADPIGTISDAQAVREAYPGATYFHLQRAHRVSEWRVNSYERAIYLKPLKAVQTTQPLLKQRVNGSFNAEDVIGGRLLRSAKGALAEARLQVIESVEGYRTEKGAANYAYLRQTNPRMRRQSREFSTTGIILQIDEPWFAGEQKEQRDLRRSLGLALKELLCRDQSIALHEIQVASGEISLRGTAGAKRLDDGLAIYDNLHGGLRLTAKLFDLLPELARRLCLAADVAGVEALVDNFTARKFAVWVDSLQPSLPNMVGQIVVPEGEHLVFAPGSLVSFRKQGLQHERRIGMPELFSFPNGEQLFYRYDCEAGAQGWVAHDAVEAYGHDWSRVLWNPHTNEMRVCQ